MSGQFYPQAVWTFSRILSPSLTLQARSQDGGGGGGGGAYERLRREISKYRRREPVGGSAGFAPQKILNGLSEAAFRAF